MKNLFREDVEQLPGAHEGKRLRIKADEPFDNIIRDSFRRHNRLYIAAMVMQQILAPSPTCIGGQPRPEVAARMALKYADALMAAADKGGE